MVGRTVTTREAHFLSHHDIAHSQHNQIQLGAEMKELFYVKPKWFTFYMRDGSTIEGPAEKMGRFFNLPVVIKKNEVQKKEIQNSNDQN